MKITIEIWQSEFNGEWNCDIRTGKDPDATEYWNVENFCDLINLLGERFPKAKIVGNPEVDNE